MGTIYESLKKTFIPAQKDNKNLSDFDTDQLVVGRSFSKNFSDEISPTIGFFDNTDNLMDRSSRDLMASSLAEQKRYIETFRDIVTHPDVSAAVSEIVNEIVFTTGNDQIVKINFNDSDTSPATKKMLTEAFDEMVRLLRFDTNAYSLINQWFVDGQLNIQTVYDNSDITRGIVKLNVLSPIDLYFDKTKQEWTYIIEEIDSFTGFTTQTTSEIKFKVDEVFKIDSGLYIDPSFKRSRNGSEKIILSELYTAIKPANQLKTVEDMLIPMRFSRSISRRVFNVDVGDLPHQKAEAAIDKVKANFKYKKFYDVEKGTISNQNHVTTLVEDYWFPNRSGGRGTTVDTLDETGNLGELGDVLYFKKKLYTALKIPMSRINNEIDGSNSEFDFTATSIQRDEVKFFAYIQRLRKKFLQLFEELMFRHLIAQGKITTDEWNEIYDSFEIYFSKENTFLQNLESEMFGKKIEAYNNVSELIGKIFSVEYTFKNILKMSDDEITEMAEQIEKEKKDPKYSAFYKTEEDSGRY
jgi:hypothetical protein